jgi:hypothetical protein
VKNPARKAALSITAASILAGCGTIGSAGLSSEGPKFVGQPVQALLADRGAPLRQMTAPSGAMIYVYEAHNLYGATFCEDRFISAIKRSWASPPTGRPQLAAARRGRPIRGLCFIQFAAM